MKALFAQAFILFSILAAAHSAPPGLTRKWKLDIAIQGRAFDQDCEFAQKDNVLSGICKGELGETRIDGSVDGRHVAWSCQADYYGTPVTLKFDGTVTDRKIIGSVMVDPLAASGDFTAQVIGQDPQKPPPGQGPEGQLSRNYHPGTMESPIVHPDGTVTFVLPTPNNVKMADVVCDYPVSKHYPNPEHVHMTKDDFRENAAAGLGI